MKRALVAEIACLLKTDPELQAILNAPGVGVTDGSPAVPGTVGEAIAGTSVWNVPSVTAGQNVSTIVSPLVLPAGDWLAMAYAYTGVPYEGLFFGISQMPPGLSTDMAGGMSLSSGNVGEVALGAPARALVSTPTLLPFTITVAGATGGSAAGAFTLQVQAWRMR